MARTFVLAGNPIYQQHYLDILAIRDGKRPRPIHYDNTYWDLLTVAGEPPGSDNGAPVAPQTLLRQAGFAEDELLKLSQAQAQTQTQAQARSDQLTHLEFAAMAMLESACAGRWTCSNCLWCTSRRCRPLNSLRRRKKAG